MVKNLPASAGDIRDMGSIPGWERSPGGDPDFLVIVVEGMGEMLSIPSCQKQKFLKEQF